MGAIEALVLSARLLWDGDEATNGMKNAGKQAGSLQSTISGAFKKIGIAIAGAFSLNAIKNFGVACIEAGAEVSAEVSAFGQIMGDYADEANEKMQSVADETGMVSTRLTPYMTSMTAKFKGLGYSVEDATDLAVRGLTLAADASAFWDMSLDESTSHLNSFINGSYEAGEAIGLFANDTQMAQYAVDQGIISNTKNWASLDEATKQATRLEYAENMMSMSGATGQAARESGAYANVMANLAEKWRQFKAQIGEPLIQNIVIPVMQKLGEILDTVSGSFKSLSAIWTNRIQPALSRLGGAVRNLFDAFKSLLPQTAQSTSGFTKMNKAASVIVAVIDVLAKGINLLADHLPELATGISIASGAMAGWKIGKFASQLTKWVKGLDLAKIKTTLWTKAQAAFNVVMNLNPIGLVVAAIAALVAAFVVAYNRSEKFRAFVDKLWASLKEKLAPIVELVSGYFKNVFLPALEKVGNFITGNIVPALQTFGNFIRENVLPPLKEFWSWLQEYIISAFQSVVSWISGELVPTFQQWGDYIMNNIVPALQELWAAIAERVQPIFQAIANFIKTVVVPAFKNIVETVKNLASTIQPWLEVVKSVISGAFNTVKSIIVNVWNYIKVFVTGAINVIRSIIQTVTALIKGDWTGVWNGIKSIAINTWNWIKTSIGAAINGVWNIITTVCSSISNTMSAAWTYIKAVAGILWEGIKSHIMIIWEGIKSAALTVWESVKTAVMTPIQAVVSWLSLAWSNIQINAMLAWNFIKTAITTVWNGIQTTATTVWNGIKTAVMTPIQAVKNWLSLTWNSIKTTVTTAFNLIKSSVTTAWNNIKTAIQTPIEKARDLVEAAIEKIKGFFDFEIKWPNIPLPHFSISPAGWKFGDLLEGSIPSLSIEWYAKAMDNAMVLKQPTVFGAAGGKLLGGGEAGNEVVAGEAHLVELITSAVAQNNAQLLNVLSKILAVMQTFDEELYDRIVDALADGVRIKWDNRELGRLVKTFA